MSQIFTVKMPDIGEGVVEGEVIEWIKKVGDKVAQDEPVVIVMTDKATVELPAPYPGILSQQYVQAGKMAIKDHPLYDLQIELQIPQAQPATPSSITHSVSLKEPPKPEPIPVPTKRSPCAPPLRKLARELGLDIDKVQGTGKGQTVTVEDLKAALSRSESAKPATVIPTLPEDEIIPLVGIQKLMARKMAQSHAEIPHFSYFEQVDARRLVELKKSIQASTLNTVQQPTYMPFLIKALSLTLKKYPLMNSSMDPSGDTLILHKPHHIGIAMSTRLGLIVPVLKDAGNMTLAQLIENYESLKHRAMENKLLPEELQGSTVTISNFGALGGNGLWATPIINYPEAAILALSKLHLAPLHVHGELALREVLNLSWSFDHRIIDGHLASSISSYYCSLIENPDSLS